MSKLLTKLLKSSISAFKKLYVLYIYTLSLDASRLTSSPDCGGEDVTKGGSENSGSVNVSG